MGINPYIKYLKLQRMTGSISDKDTAALVVYGFLSDLLKDNDENIKNDIVSVIRCLSKKSCLLSDIIKEFRNGLILYLNNYVQNIHIAEDLSEEVFVRLIVNKPRFHKRSNFKTWLYTIGRNIAIDYLRKESKISEHSRN